MGGPPGEDPPAHLRWCYGRAKRFKTVKLPFFVPTAPPGPAHPAGPSGLVPVGGPYPSTLWPKIVAIGPCRPLSLYPLADFSPHLTWRPLSIYPRPLSLYPSADFSPGRAGWSHLGALIPLPSGRKSLRSALVALPFGRFFASSHLAALIYLPSGQKSVRSALVAIPFGRFFASSHLGALVSVPFPNFHA